MSKKVRQFYNKNVPILQANSILHAKQDVFIGFICLLASGAPLGLNPFPAPERDAKAKKAEDAAEE